MTRILRIEIGKVVKQEWLNPITSGCVLATNVLFTQKNFPTRGCQVCHKCTQGRKSLRIFAPLTKPIVPLQRDTEHAANLQTYEFLQIRTTNSQTAHILDLKFSVQSHHYYYQDFRAWRPCPLRKLQDLVR